jgi:N6-adenosine-specific RNA methylase IME4
MKEQKEKLSNQKISINKMYHEIRKKVIQKNVKNISLPKSNFSIIYADCPWRYDFSQTNERSIETHYSSMSLEQLKNIKIPSEKDAILFLWATSPKLKEALEVMESWGFEYKTHCIWDKEIIGMGYWFRGQHELLLLGTKGKVKTPNEKNRISSIIRFRRGKHSEKPKIFYDIIEKMFPNEKYLELFARNRRKNWISWGNEIK